VSIIRDPGGGIRFGRVERKIPRTGSKLFVFFFFLNECPERSNIMWIGKCCTRLYTTRVRIKIIIIQRGSTIRLTPLNGRDHYCCAATGLLTTRFQPSNADTRLRVSTWIYLFVSKTRCSSMRKPGFNIKEKSLNTGGFFILNFVTIKSK